MALCYIWRPQHNLAYQSTLMWSLCDVVCVVLLDTFQLLTKLLHNVVYVHICHEYIHAHVFSRPECNILISNVQIAPQRCVRPFYCSRVMFFSFTLKVNILIGDLTSCDYIEYRSSRRWHEVALHHFFVVCVQPRYIFHSLIPVDSRRGRTAMLRVSIFMFRGVMIWVCSTHSASLLIFLKIIFTPQRGGL